MQNSWSLQYKIITKKYNYTKGKFGKEYDSKYYIQIINEYTMFKTLKHREKKLKQWDEIFTDENYWGIIKKYSQKKVKLLQTL